ncbi:MAG: hypothetical protein IT559_09450 [Alphaproteobacteria bacterium]|nr:hypothetical protein [Alphaproteobacteria bacterium]
MKALVAAAELALADRLIGNRSRFTGPGKAEGALLGVSGVLLVLGFGFLIYAANLRLAQLYSQDTAMLFTGLLCLLLAGFCVLGVLAILNLKRSKIAQIKKEISETLVQILGAAEEEVSGQIKQQPEAAILISALSGYIAGEKFL